MTTQGPNYPSTVANRDQGGKPAWSNPTNAQGADDATVAVVVDAGSGTDFLEGTGLGWTGLTGATITNVLVEAKIKSAAAIGDNVTTLYLRDTSHTKYGSAGGYTNGNLETTLQWRTYFNAAPPTGFAAVIIAGTDEYSFDHGFFASTVSIDAIRVTITYTVVTPAQLVLSAAAGVATAATAVTAPSLVVPGASAGVATATVALLVPSLVTLAAIAGIATAILDPLDAPTAGMELGQIDGIATAALALGSPALLSMLADGVAAATLLLHSPALLAMVADGLSDAVLAVIAPALLAMAAAGLSTAAITVISPTLLIIQSDGVATAVAAVTVTPNLVLGQVDGVATATLSELGIFLRKRHRLDGGSLIFSTRFNGGKPIIHTSMPGGMRIYK